jgi:hypothetical protein
VLVVKHEPTNDLRTMAKQGPCWDGYVQEGFKKKNGRNVPNCVRAKMKAQSYKKSQQSKGR